MTEITVTEEDGFICVLAKGHANAVQPTLAGDVFGVTAGKVCAIISTLLMTLWTVACAEGTWEGPEGGDVSFRVAARHQEYLVFTFVALSALANTYPYHLKLSVESAHLSHLLDLWEQINEKSPGNSPQWQTTTGDAH